MILSIPLYTYNNQYLTLLQPVKNNMMERGLFTRILYSTTNVIFNGLYVNIQGMIPSDIYVVEKNILKVYNTTKYPLYSIEKQLNRHPSKSILKISGIWENDTSYGLAYKIIE
jgi:hypothetical protein